MTNQCNAEVPGQVFAVPPADVDGWTEKLQQDTIWRFVVGWMAAGDEHRQPASIGAIANDLCISRERVEKMCTRTGMTLVRT